MLEWALWARGSKLTANPQHPLASIIQLAAGENFGHDLSVPDELTPALEAVEKAIAQLNIQNPMYKRIIMRFWLRHVPVHVLASQLGYGEEFTRELIGRAERQVGRNILEIEAKRGHTS